MPTKLVQILLLAALLISPGLRAAEVMTFIHPPPENPDDLRHTYYWELLDAALASNRAQFGDYRIVSFATPMSFPRAAAEVEAHRSGRTNIIARATNLDLERRLRAIPLPLDKGLLGYRVFLTLPATQARLAAQVHSVADLKKFSIGQSSTWTDTSILASNGFKLILSDSYEGLFAMLAARRFELFSRGVNEVMPEWRTYHQRFPEIGVERTLVLAYPMPRYFFVPRTPQGERMAARITDGLQRLAHSGEFNRRYTQWKHLVLDGLDLHGRQVLRIPNPQLSAAAPPPSDTFWWDSLSAELAPAK